MLARLVLRENKISTMISDMICNGVEGRVGMWFAVPATKLLIGLVRWQSTKAARMSGSSGGRPI